MIECPSVSSGHYAPSNSIVTIRFEPGLPEPTVSTSNVKKSLSATDVTFIFVTREDTRLVVVMVGLFPCVVNIVVAEPVPVPLFTSTVTDPDVVGAVPTEIHTALIVNVLPVLLYQRYTSVVGATSVPLYTERGRIICGYVHLRLSD